MVRVAGAERGEQARRRRVVAICESCFAAVVERVRKPGIVGVGRAEIGEGAPGLAEEARVIQGVGFGEGRLGGGGDRLREGEGGRGEEYGDQGRGEWAHERRWGGGAA